MTQEKQMVFSGVLTGFTLLVHGARDQRRKFDTVEEMEKSNARLQEVALQNGWEDLVETHSMIRFKPEHSSEEEIPIEDYNLVGLKIGRSANKVYCKCGKPMWRLGTIEQWKDKPPYICEDCRDEDAIDSAIYLEEIDADPRDYPQ